SRGWSDVAPGVNHQCGVRSADGAIECWGSAGLIAAPVGEFSAASAGVAHTCAIRSEGSVACWGAPGTPKGTAPTGQFDVLAAGFVRTCALRSSGRWIGCWGDDGEGQVSGAPLGSYRRIASGADHSCAAFSNGTVLCWGDDSAGQAAP